VGTWQTAWVGGAGNVLGAAALRHFETRTLAQILNEDSAVGCGPMFPSLCGANEFQKVFAV